MCEKLFLTTERHIIYIHTHTYNRNIYDEVVPVSPVNPFRFLPKTSKRSKRGNEAKLWRDNDKMTMTEEREFQMKNDYDG
jgi:hypothetical protein